MPGYLSRRQRRGAVLPILPARMGQRRSAVDPSAPPSRRSDAVWPPTPQSSPPMPFTEWPYGGTQNIGVTRPNSVDTPLMVAIANTQLGKAMNDAHVQVYGWLAPAANISSNTVKPGGNAPAAYDYTPNTVQLDQAGASMSNAWPTPRRTITSTGASASRHCMASIIATRRHTGCSATSFSTTTTSTATTFQWSTRTSISL